MEDTQSSTTSQQNTKEDGLINLKEFITSMIFAEEEDQPGECSSNIPNLQRTKTVEEMWSNIDNYCDSNYKGQTKNLASPKTLENDTLEKHLARAGIFTEELPPQQTLYQKGLKERRRLRMIKNRELAAQFRENKQAYNVHLEQELYALREENKHLKLLMKYEEEQARENTGDATQSQ